MQHPRWNLEAHGFPVSTLMRYDIKRRSTFYIIVHREDEPTITGLKQMLNRGGITQTTLTRSTSMLLSSPLEIHVMLMILSFEASKHHVKRFQRYMWKQVGLKAPSIDPKG